MTRSRDALWRVTCRRAGGGCCLLEVTPRLLHCFRLFRVKTQTLSSRFVFYSIHIDSALSPHHNCMRSTCPRSLTISVHSSTTNPFTNASWSIITGMLHSSLTFHITGTRYRMSVIPLPILTMHAAPWIQHLQCKEIEYLRSSSLSSTLSSASVSRTAVWFLRPRQ